MGSDMYPSETTAAGDLRRRRERRSDSLGIGATDQTASTTTSSFIQSSSPLTSSFAMASSTVRTLTVTLRSTSSSISLVRPPSTTTACRVGRYCLSRIWPGVREVGPVPVRGSTGEVQDELEFPALAGSLPCPEHGERQLVVVLGAQVLVVEGDAVVHDPFQVVPCIVEEG